MPPKGSQVRYPLMTTPRHIANKSQKAKVEEPSKAKAKAKPKAAPVKKETPPSEAESSSDDESAPSTPAPAAKSKPAVAVTPKKTTPQSAARKKKEPTTYKRLGAEDNMPVQIDVKFEGGSVQAQQITDGVYGHTLKLQAANAFKLVKTVSSPHASQAASLVGSPFKFILANS